MTYQIKPRGLVSTNLSTKNFFFEIIEAEKTRGRGGLEMKSEKLPFHPHGSLRAGYAKCYFAHLLYYLFWKNWQCSVSFCSHFLCLNIRGKSTKTNLTKDLICGLSRLQHLLFLISHSSCTGLLFVSNLRLPLSNLTRCHID